MLKNFFGIAIPVSIMFSILAGFLLLNGMFWGGML
jgi:hypothetical protein